MISFATLLSDQQIGRVHAASLHILETVGVLVRHEKARIVFQKHGCSVDNESQLVKFPERVVEEFRRMAPPTFTFLGRDPKYDRTIPGTGPWW